MPPGNGAENSIPPVIQSQDLASSLPAPVLRLLIIFSRPIASLRHGLEVLTWKKGKRVESWMVVGAWWILCLGSGHVFRWLLPPLLFFPLIPLSNLRLRHEPAKPTPSGTHPSQTTSHQSLLITLSDLYAINNLLPPSPIPTTSDIYARFRLLGVRRLLRGLLVIWSTWVVLGRIIGYSSLLALIGSIILLLPSPPLAQLFNLLSRSLAIRRAAALCFILAFGSPPDQAYPISLHFSPLGWVKSKWATSRRPSLAFSFRPKTRKGGSKAVSGSAIMDDDEEEDITRIGASSGDGGSQSIYFRFEVHENQRWWMGLDWTGALLPQERPTWCDSHLLPVSPPASFSLPPSSSIILPSSDSSGSGRVKRTAVWKWLDDDWSIVREGQGRKPSNTPLPASTSQVIPAASPPLPSEENNGNEKRRSFSGLSTSPSNSSVMEETMAGRAHSMAEQAFTKGLERLKARTTTSGGSNPSSPAGKTSGGLASVTSPLRTSGEFKRTRTGSQASEDLKEAESAAATGSTSAVPAPVESIVEKDEATDPDGWVYGDNKWENAGPKGGLGRFTRRRRWQRRAILTETVEHLIPEPWEDIKDPSTLKSPATPKLSDVKTGVSGELYKPSAEARPSPIVEEKEDLEDLDEDQPQNGHNSTPKAGCEVKNTSDHAQSGGTGASTATSARDDALRMRLKKAMGNMGA